MLKVQRALQQCFFILSLILFIHKLKTINWHLQLNYKRIITLIHVLSSKYLKIKKSIESNKNKQCKYLHNMCRDLKYILHRKKKHCQPEAM